VSLLLSGAPPSSHGLFCALGVLVCVVCCCVCAALCLAFVALFLCSLCVHVFVFSDLWLQVRCEKEALPALVVFLVMFSLLGGLK